MGMEPNLDSGVVDALKRAYLTLQQALASEGRPQVGLFSLY